MCIVIYVSSLYYTETRSTMEYGRNSQRQWYSYLWSFSGVWLVSWHSWEANCTSFVGWFRKNYYSRNVSMNALMHDHFSRMSCPWQRLTREKWSCVRPKIFEWITVLQWGFCKQRRSVFKRWTDLLARPGPVRLPTKKLKLCVPLLLLFLFLFAPSQTKKFPYKRSLQETYLRLQLILFSLADIWRFKQEA